MSEWQEEECGRNWLPLAWHSSGTPEVLHCAGSGQGPLPALLGQSQAEKRVLEWRCLLGCAQWQFFRRGNRELVGFPDPAWDGQTWFTLRDEWTLLRGTAEIGSWGFRALLSYPGFANLPANSKQAPKPCTSHKTLPRSTALPSTQGRQVGWALPHQQLPVQLRQCQRREGAPRLQTGSIGLHPAAHHPGDGY